MLIASLHLLTIPIGVAYAQIMEWLLHKYVLHNLGKKKNSKWSSHWHVHHRTSRKNKNIDKDYEKSFLDPAHRSEVAGLFFILLFHLPILFYLPLFYCTLVFCSIHYFVIHRKSHLNTEWCKKNLPWHYDHHMGKNQNANWGVTTDWVDRLMKTRIEYFKD